MTSRVVLALVTVAAGCDRVFDVHQLGPSPEDAPAIGCYGVGVTRICLDAPPEGHFEIAAGATTIVDNQFNCAPYVGPGGLCVIAADTIEIAGTLRGIAQSPVVLVAATSVTIDGTVDVSSKLAGEHGAGSDPLDCAGMLFGMSSSGGGAGGSFGGKGGNGGDGDLLFGGGNGGTAAPATGTPDRLRGGCHGGNGAQNGDSGPGGGAFYAIAGATITIAGTVDASGSAGAAGHGAATPGGGGGAGAGGMIGLDAPTIAISGAVFANGGGGGEGGGDPADGMRGEDPAVPDVPAAGGAGAAVSGGDGGNGAANTTAAKSGSPGTNQHGGGGGGGGGAGVIVVFPSQVFGSNVSPPPR